MVVRVEQRINSYALQGGMIVTETRLAPSSQRNCEACIQGFINPCTNPIKGCPNYCAEDPCEKEIKHD